MTHLTEQDLILLYYSEPGVPADAPKHLAQCPECRAAAEALAETLGVCNEWTLPEPSADFGRDAWNRLVPVLDIPAILPKPRWHAVRVWAAATGLAVLLAAVFMAGRMSRPAESPVAGLSDQARDRILENAVADHLDRVQMLMTEIDDDRIPDSGGLAIEKQRAEDLAQEGRLMRQSLAARGDTATTSFLDETDNFLVEAAHTPDSASGSVPDPGLRDLRERLDSGSLLFKVRVVESNLREALGRAEAGGNIAKKEQKL